MSDHYEKHYRRSPADPEAYWGEAAAGIDWIRPFEKVLGALNAPIYRWFAGGELNTCYNAVDRHVEGGRGDDAALVFDSALTGTKRTLTFVSV